MKTKNMVMGILAHVDAGKTTLSEDILYFSGSIRKLGRVDHGNAFLDTDQLERARGITIFSKQAQFMLGDRNVTLLDTPGHTDFAAEMERTLQVLDYAVLIINGADGVQSHTMTLWKLLKHYQVPVFLFVNKMDQVGTDRQSLLSEIQHRLDERCLDFTHTSGDEFWENVAMCDEQLMEEYLQSAQIDREHIQRAIRKRSVFPCYFGSALKLDGVEEFLKGLELYCCDLSYPQKFGAKVYKITRDTQGNRLTHMKITGGTLRVKTLLTNEASNEEELWQEKVNQIRIYSGSQFQMVSEVAAGTVCAVLGLSKTYSGEGLGSESATQMPVLQPVLTYQIILPDGYDVHKMLLQLRQLEEEEPQLHIVWNEQANEIHAQMMGEIEIEVLKSVILERFGVAVEFGTGSIVYKESILEPVIGVGHFEPLRHYAEVHLLLEPGARGSGLQFASSCSEDTLDRNWQRLILSHLMEKKHKGVLTGSEITDMKITLVAGKAHQKHTEGGDFRQATYRAVRQGLKKAESVLLEPYYEFELEVPTETVGRALADLQRMNATFEPPHTEETYSFVKGSAPVTKMRDYPLEVAAYTKGQGRLFCHLKGYEVCKNQEEVINQIGYDAEQDLENPTGSVFCAHGAGFVVSWQEVEQFMHVDSGWKRKEADNNDWENQQVNSPKGSQTISRNTQSGYADEEELAAIFRRTYGETKRERNPIHKRPKVEQRSEQTTTLVHNKATRRTLTRQNQERYLVVDGYNIIFAWEELKELAAVSLDGANEKLIEILSNYQGYTNDRVIVVFDAYKVKGGQGSTMKHHNVYVVYTKETEKADQYIEKIVGKIGRKYDVTVATSDQLVQMISWGEGAKRLSAQELKMEIETVNQEIRTKYLKLQGKGKNYPLQKLGEQMQKGKPAISTIEDQK